MSRTGYLGLFGVFAMGLGVNRVGLDGSLLGLLHGRLVHLPPTLALGVSLRVGIKRLVRLVLEEALSLVALVVTPVVHEDWFAEVGADAAVS